MKRMFGIAIATLITLGLSFARADVALLKDEPKSTITAKQAAEAALKGESVSQCTKQIFGEKGRQKPVKGANPKFVKTADIKHDESAALAMLDGKQIWNCKTKSFDLATGKFANN